MIISPYIVFIAFLILVLVVRPCLTHCASGPFICYLVGFPTTGHSYTRSADTVLFPRVAPHVRTPCDVHLCGVAAYMKPKIIIQHLFHFHKLSLRIWSWRYLLARLVSSFCLTVFARVMFSLSVVVLPDIQHIAHGPPSSTKPNPFRSAGRQTSHLLGVPLLGLVVRFSSRGLIPRITLSQPYLTLTTQLSRLVFRTGLLSIWGRHTYERDIYTSTCA